MTLKEYMTEKNIGAMELAGRLDINFQGVYKYLAGRIPRPEIMQRIVELTEGQVTADDFYRAAAELQREEPQA